MIMQLGLDFESPDFKNLSLSERFQVFHKLNPAVYNMLARLARKAVAQGKRRVGIGMLWEVMRWEIWLDTTDAGSEFKLNNDYRSRYARMIMETEPDLAGIFETRKLKTS